MSITQKSASTMQHTQDAVQFSHRRSIFSFIALILFIGAMALGNLSYAFAQTDPPYDPSDPFDPTNPVGSTTLPVSECPECPPDHEGNVAHTSSTWFEAEPWVSSDPITTVIPFDGFNCVITYCYCYRTVKRKNVPNNPNPADFPNMHDAYISSFKVKAGCMPPGPFNKELYDSIYDGCMADLVGRVDPWNVAGEIPDCNTAGDSWSSPYYRFFRAACTSDWFTLWEDGHFWKKTVPCRNNCETFQYYEETWCAEIYQFCWQEMTDPQTGNTVHKLIERVVADPAIRIVYFPNPQYDYAPQCYGCQIAATNKYGQYVDSSGQPLPDNASDSQLYWLDCNAACK